MLINHIEMAIAKQIANSFSNLFIFTLYIEFSYLHFTPKTYIFIAAYCHNVELLTPSTSFHPYRNYDFFCKPYANIRNWCPQCLGKLLSFLFTVCL